MLKANNKGAVDLAKNWSASGWTRHIDVEQYFQWVLKEDVLLEIEHVSGYENDADLFMKNCKQPTFEKHLQMYYGINDYGEHVNMLKVMWDLPSPWAS